MEPPQLYPLSIGEILDRAFRLYRRHFGLLIGITMAAYVPMTVLQILSFFTFRSTQIVDLIQNSFISLLISGALTSAISNLYLGNSVSMNEAYQAIRERYGSAWGGQFLVGLFIAIPIMSITCALLFFLSIQDQLRIFIVILVLIPIVLFLTTRWSLMLPAILLESHKAKEGLDRSWELTEGIFGHVFWTTSLAGLLIYIFSIFPQLAFAYGLEFFVPGSSYGPLVQTVFSQIALIFASPLSIAVNVVLFYDILVRKEGFDLKFQLEHDFLETEEETNL
ncbi:MAG: glycerophosphoryl diester phosphodiesterase membrane domain-containing protein [Anaerolineales bacterium]|nr:glycerophosphoryl diester phosphodiesterase membrane domain-containing protein [Anaerolineales bacterium]